MEGGNQPGTAVLVDTAAQPRDRIERAQQGPRGERTERHDDLRLDDVDLLKQKRLARFDFVLLRIAIAGRAAFDDVGDVHVFTLQIDGFDDLRQQLTGTADKRDALQVLVAAWRLADEHQIRIRIADT